MLSKRYIPSRKKTETVLTNNVTAVGSPIIRRSVLCQLSSTSYATFSALRPSSYAWEQRFKVRTGLREAQGFVVGGASQYSKPAIGVGQNGWEIYVSSNGSSWDLINGEASNTTIEARTDYYLKFGWDTTDYYLEVSEDGSTYERVIEVSNSVPIYDSSALGTLGWCDGSAWNGEIDLTGCSSTVWDTVDGTSEDYTYYEYDPTVTWTGTTETQSTSTVKYSYLPIRKKPQNAEKNNIILNGSAQINGHILSNFTASTTSWGTFYLKHPINAPYIHNFEIEAKFKINAQKPYSRVFQVNGSGNKDFPTGLYIEASSAGVSLNCYNGADYDTVVLVGAADLEVGEWYWVKAVYKDSAISGYYSKDGLSYQVAETFLYNSITTYGSPTRNGALYSGFTTSNYLAKSGNLPATLNKVVYELKFKFTGASGNMDILSINNSSSFSNGWNIATNSSKRIRLWCSSSGEVWGTTVMDVNTWYWVRVVCDSTSCVAYLSSDGETYTEECTQTNSQWSSWPSSTVWLGVRRYSSSNVNEAFTTGTIDLEDSRIYVNDELWWKPIDKVTSKPFMWANFQESIYKIGQRNDANSQLNGEVDLTGCSFKANNDILWKGVDFDYTAYNVTKVGSPWVMDDSIYRFSDSDYYTVPDFVKRDGTLIMCFLYGDPASVQTVLMNEGLYYLEPSTDNIFTYSASGGQSYPILEYKDVKKYTKYWVKTVFEGNNQTFSYSMDGVHYKPSVFFVNTGTPQTTYMGRHRMTGRAFTSGCIYLEECSFVDPSGNVIWKPYISYPSDGNNLYLPSVGIVGGASESE